MATIKALTGSGWLKDADDNFQSLASLAGLHVTKFTFDAEADDNTAETPVSNKTVANHPMGVSIPDNAVVVDGWVEVITAIDSVDDGATISVGLVAETKDDLLDSATQANLAADKVVSMAAVKTAPVKLAAETEINVAVETKALTAGKFIGHIVWMEGA